MKNNRLTILGLLVVGTMLIAACGGAAGPAKADDKVKAVYVIGGTLGDKSFIDSADRGLTKAVEDFGIEYVPVEASATPRKSMPLSPMLLNDPNRLISSSRARGSDRDTARDCPEIS